MTGPKSLRLEILAYVFLTSVFIIVLLGSLVVVQISQLTNTIAREDLLEQARKIASYMEYDWLGRLDLDLTERYRDYYAEKGADHQFAVTNPNGGILFKSENFMEDQIKPVLEHGGRHYFSFVTPDGKSYMALKYDYLFEDRIYPIFIIENEQVFSRFLTTLKEDFFVKLAIYGSPLLLFQGFCIIFILRGALKPVLRVSREAEEIKYNNLSLRLGEKNIPSEILPLIRSFNTSLARLEQSAEAQKFFIVNAAHELRTPISILKARIASLQNEKEIFMLNEDLRSINRLISQLLDISRLDYAESAQMQEISLNAVARKACEDIGALFVSKDKELSLEEIAQDQVITGNEDTLSRAVLNLLENALKHSPAGSPVQVIVDEGRIVVRDFGSPVPEEYRDKIFERFEKLPQSLSARGSGLGLAIVRKAAEIHGGQVHLVVREDGNDFILDFSGVAAPRVVKLIANS